MFSADGTAFIMYARHARSWIALYDPVGPKSAWPELIWSFVETARAAGGRAVFYQVRPDNLAVYADAGLAAFKLGEDARIALADFDLKGSKRYGLRQTISRGERDGLTYELLMPGTVEPLIGELKQISDRWLAHHKAREKRFSLGAFREDYVAAQPVAILRHREQIVAFATILTTATGHEASVDLMRFDQAPGGSMEFLFLKLILDFQQKGYTWFNLGMAPLSGLSDSPAAPIWHRVGRTVFEHAERFYNFRGLRAFKAKFHPQWRPRYLAVSGRANPVWVLADVTLLIGGGLKGVVRK
jgi:phosphatidylglycerol lysyltransferase